ncbi:MAG: hypothetical protein ABSB15_17765 [Bryobacteraceae bacterium]|jgi:RNA-directed DNA polymerase
MRLRRWSNQLGIPVVVDRLVQEAILQVLDPIFDPTCFQLQLWIPPRKKPSHGFGAGPEVRSSGRARVCRGPDLEKFFDRVNHDILMSRIARRIGDKRLILIIRRFLQAGMMLEGGVRYSRAGNA